MAHQKENHDERCCGYGWGRRCAKETRAPSDSRGASSGPFCRSLVGFLRSVLAAFSNGKKDPKEIAFVSDYVFVDLPQIALTLSGPKSRTLALAVKVAAKPENVAQIEFLQPRILDAFNGFLSEIDPLAFEKKGIIDVVRNELSTRLTFILGRAHSMTFLSRSFEFNDDPSFCRDSSFRRLLSAFRILLFPYPKASTSEQP
ncbi:hypothetical protein QWZ10_13175 [Paracoccus cavernae]|uniref:Uncharacterized protein n=1 Tax=Paracoccus cavernae TaxID=1571207 RepID=A0ABT8D976_9RHOB|nr:hypothetical protein [Paracoccus cavernae]